MSGQLSPLKKKKSTSMYSTDSFYSDRRRERHNSMEFSNEKKMGRLSEEETRKEVTRRGGEKAQTPIYLWEVPPRGASPHLYLKGGGGERCYEERKKFQQKKNWEVSPLHLKVLFSDRLREPLPLIYISRHQQGTELR